MGVGVLAELVRDSPSVVKLTGAGVSTASGMPDLRRPGTGLWERVDPTEVAGGPDPACDGRPVGRAGTPGRRPRHGRHPERTFRGCRRPDHR